MSFAFDKSNVQVMIEVIPPPPPPPEPKISEVIITLNVAQTEMLMAILGRTSGGLEHNPLSGLYTELYSQGLRADPVTKYIPSIRIGEYVKRKGEC